jgi:hypothetical protein
VVLFVEVDLNELAKPRAVVVSCCFGIANSLWRTRLILDASYKLFDTN